MQRYTSDAPPTEATHDAAVPEAASRLPRRPRRVLQGVGYALALVLLGGSVYWSVRGGDFSRLLEARPDQLLTLLVLVLLGGVVSVGAMFSLLYAPFTPADRPISRLRMQQLVVASAMLNYTPVKAGLIGRVVYTRHRHGVSYVASMVIHLVIGGCVFVPIFAALLVTLLYPHFDGWWAAAVTGLSVLAAWLGAALLGHLRPEPLAMAVARTPLGRSARRWFPLMLGGIALGHVVLWFTAGRLYVAFEIFGSPIAYRDALYLAMVDSAARSLFVANGLGLREWLIGFGASEGLLTTRPPLSTALAATLIDRAAEALVVVPLGLLALARLHRARDGQATSRTDQPE